TFDLAFSAAGSVRVQADKTDERGETHAKGRLVIQGVDRGDTLLQMREDKLNAIEGRRIGRGRVRRASLPDPLFLWLQYRNIHDRMKPRQGVSRPVLEDALPPEWIRCGASGKVPDSVFKTLRTSPRSTGARKAAVEFVSKAYGAKPHTLPA